MNTNGNNKNEDGKKQGMKDFIVSPAGKFCLIFALYVIILGLTASLIGILGGGPGFGVALVIFVYFGWKALNRLTPNIFLIMPVGGWLIYYVVKLVLSIFIGVFVAPFVLAKKITAAIQKNYDK